MASSSGDCRRQASETCLNHAELSMEFGGLQFGKYSTVESLKIWSQISFGSLSAAIEWRVSSRSSDSAIKALSETRERDKCLITCWWPSRHRFRSFSANRQRDGKSLRRRGVRTYFRTTTTVTTTLDGLAVMEPFQAKLAAAGTGSLLTAITSKHNLCSGDQTQRANPSPFLGPHPLPLRFG